MESHPNNDDAALAARLEALRPGLEALGLPACIFDAGIRYLLVNHAYARHYHRDYDEFIGRTPDQVFEGRALAPDQRRHMTRALGGEAATYDREVKNGPNARRWVRAHYFPVQLGEGHTGVLCVMVDIQHLKDAERKLGERTRQLEAITQNVGMPMSYIDAHRRFRYSNQPGLDWQPGRTKDNVIGMRIEDVVPAEVLAEVTPHLDRALAGEPVAYERQGRDRDGRVRWIRVHLIPDTDAEGKTLGAYSIVVDIDEDRRLRDALKRQEQQLRFFAENIPGPIAFVGPDFRFRFANNVFLRTRGLALEEVVGRPVSEGFAPELRDKYYLPFLEPLKRGETCQYERLVEVPGAGERWHLVRLVPLQDGAGAFDGYYIVGTDIHDIKTAEEQLRLFTENIPETIAHVDRDKRYRFVNRAFTEVHGKRREQILGRTTEEILGKDVAQRFGPLFEEAHRTGKPTTYERLASRGAGEPRWIRVSLVPHFDDEGNVLGTYSISHDIHELKAAQQDLADKERQLRQVIDSIPNPMVYCDADGRYRYVNEAFLAYIGLEADQVIGHTVRELLGEERWALFAPSLERVRAGESLQVERLIRFADGRSRWMNVRLTPRLDAEGRFIGHYATSSDIHEQKMVEQELRRTNTLLSAHFDNTPLAVIEWDTELRVVRWSGQAEQVFGWSASDALGRSTPSWRLVYEEDSPTVADIFSRLASGREPNATFLSRNYRRDGSVIWVEWHNSALRDEVGRVVSILSLAQDVSSRIQAEERLQFMATHDGLTGLPNRVLLNDRLEGALARARRGNRRVAVMFLDLDRFKDVNDTLGHRVGDALLRELARRLRATLRQSDLLARISGDEFVMVLEDLPDDEAPERIAAKVLDEARRAFSIEGHELQVSASLGLALFPEDGQEGDSLLKNADAAMYSAKEMGRNTFRLYSSELAARRTHRLETEKGLRRALAKGELELHYQPVVDLATGKVEAAEALLRWNDPARGLVLPGEFLPLAEETGLGHEIGQWVLQAACRQARAWRDAGLGSIMACVNVSAGQLRDATLVTGLKRLFAKTGCEASWLQLEITETSMVRDLEGTSQTLAKLRALGVKIAIDDFGTGFSSLSHLRHLPVDTLKIDKSFVADIDAAPGGKARAGSGSATIVSAVLGLAKGLKLDVIAEGIETPAQRAFLVRSGCASGQGYLYCAPLPAASFAEWMLARKKTLRKKGK